MRDDNELTHSVRVNPWARAIWERKHPEGPVLIVWQLAPLPFFVAGWIPFAGRKCIPSLVSGAEVREPALIDAFVEQLGEEAFTIGPSAKMVDHAKSIAAAYATNGRKGGRPKNVAKRVGLDTRTEGAQTGRPVTIATGPTCEPGKWVWTELEGSARPGEIWKLESVADRFDACFTLTPADQQSLYNLRRAWREGARQFAEDYPLRNAPLSKCFAAMEALSVRPAGNWRRGEFVDTISSSKAV